MRIGSMLKEIPKATPNNNPFHENSPADNLVKTKSDATKELGFTPKQVSQFQRMAEHEDVNSQNENPACYHQTGFSKQKKR